MRMTEGVERQSNIAIVALLAGFAGGMAEIAWVLAYFHWTGQSAAIVAREVAASLFLPYEGSAAPLLGTAIHMALSLALGLVYAACIWRPSIARRGTSVSLMVAAALLAMIWAINFFWLLPILNPRFIGLMPYSVTLVSKILFGISMGWVLKRAYDSDSFRTKQPCGLVAMGHLL